jgi:hypothetical protein
LVGEVRPSVDQELERDKQRVMHFIGEDAGIGYWNLLNRCLVGRKRLNAAVLRLWREGRIDMSAGKFMEVRK